MLSKLALKSTSGPPPASAGARCVRLDACSGAGANVSLGAATVVITSSYRTAVMIPSQLMAIRTAGVEIGRFPCDAMPRIKHLLMLIEPLLALLEI
jgi:hypothetical protein